MNTEEVKKAHCLNLVSRGFPMAKAREISGYHTVEVRPSQRGLVKPSEPEVEEAPEPEVDVEEAPEPEVDERGELRAKLKELGVKSSPNASVKTLKKKLEVAESDLL